ncbi:hypothetical protein [Metabacillus sp. FJAT-52054]|uniref:Uncharacterized protein n=1 Tax=Metabacillus sediminis TaxID=3117746 RepID=A0ABZ2NDZ8_9BACI
MTGLNQDELEKKIDELNKKIERLESKLQQPHNIGSNIWVLVPVAAIIMWGLTKIF